ncbi:hypothetical protein DL768_002558 [Monosporascus sp. mg162]|nr:hypothetical protein DL768_002558 [Monosporascus sp. mg162]
MQFTIVQAIALFVAGAIAMPSNMEAGDLNADNIEARVKCRQRLPACAGGHIVGQTNCRCRYQREICDLWTCPGPSPNVMVCGQASTGCVWI